MSEPVYRAVTPPRAIDSDAESFASWMNVLLRRRWRVLMFGVICAMVMIAVVLTSKRSYASHAAIMPEARKSSSLLGGLASQFNIALPSDASGDSPAFYADLLRSRELLGSAVDSKYTYVDKDGQTRTGTLVDAFDAHAPTAPLRREVAIDMLLAASGVEVAPKTGVIRVWAEGGTPVLAQQITQRLIELLDQFNRQRRKSRAAAERAFTQQRMQDMSGELRQAEDRLQSFLQQNRNWNNSPELTFQRDRLNNDVMLKRELYSSVSKAFESSRIDEVRDTPVITVTEAPAIPVRPESRGGVRKLIFGFIFGLILGIVFAIAGELRNPSEAVGDPVEEFHRLRREALLDLVHPLATIRRLFGRTSRTRPAASR